MALIKENAGENIKCPQCKKVASIINNPYKPFCSERCKMVDLGAWLSERYKVSGGKNDGPDPIED